MHQAYWLLKQLHQLCSIPEFFINFRCIHNGKPYTEPTSGKKHQPSSATYDECFPISELKAKWDSVILPKLTLLNYADMPSNVYFAINPLKSPGHKKEFFAQFNVLYLDLDSNKGYTKEQRWMQIWYWQQLGFAPSIVIDSGNGYHVYWILMHAVSREIGEEILKKMVALADCKAGGNTFDISRVFRLPGFRNAKEWFNNSLPPCGIVVPAADDLDKIEKAQAYGIEEFNYFPPSSLKDLEGYFQKIQSMSTSPEEFKANVKAMFAELAVQQKTEAVKQATTEVYTANKVNAAKKFPWEPTLTVVPIVNEVKWGKNNNWVKKFVVVGYQGMEQGELDELKVKHNFTDTSCSALDFQVIYLLCKNGYTKEAIRDFWMRQGHKLYRADKEAKNEAYFDTSYDKAFSYIKAGHEAKTKPSDAPDIFEEFNQTYFRDRSDNVDCILSFTLRLDGVYTDEDALSDGMRDWYDLTIVYPDATNPQGVSTRKILIPNIAFNDVRKLREFLAFDTIRVMTDNSKVLQKYLRYLLARYANAPRHRFHSAVIYHDGVFVFPTFDIHEDQFVVRDDLPIVATLKKKFPLFDKFKVTFETPETLKAQLQANWGNTLRCHLPTMLCAVLGSIAASALKPVFEHKLAVQGFHIPTLNVRGGSGTAKTETLRHLCTFAGLKPMGNCVSLFSSNFALSRYLSLTNFLPIIIDEFKDDGDRETQYRMNSVRRLIRSMFSGEAMLRGQSDLSVKEIETHANLIISGETPLERQGDISEVSRVYPVETDLYDTTKNQHVWKSVRDVHWYALAPHFYQFVLKQDAAAVYKEFLGLAEHIEGLLLESFGPERIRIGRNIATLWLGCRLIDRFIHSIDPALPRIEDVCKPQAALVTTFIENAKYYGTSMAVTVMHKNDGIGTPIAVTNNELIALIKQFGHLLEMRDRSIRERQKDNTFVYHEVVETTEHPASLCVHLSTMLDCVTEHATRLGLNRPPSIAKLRALLRAAVESQQPWLIHASGLVRHGSGMLRCLRLNLLAVRQMKIWPEKDVLADNSTPDIPDLPSGNTLI